MISVKDAVRNSNPNWSPPRQHEIFKSYTEVTMAALREQKVAEQLSDSSNVNYERSILSAKL